MKWSRVAASALFGAAMLSSAVAMSFGRDGDRSWASVFGAGLWIAGSILVINTIAALYARRARSRLSDVRHERPTAVVFESGRFGGLGALLPGDGPPGFLTYVTVAVTAEAITFWRDYSPPRVWHTIVAAEVRDLAIEEFVVGGRTRSRLSFTTKDGAVKVPVLGEGRSA